MKRCPKCRTEYFDNMLDFCLDDGERLLLVEVTEDSTRGGVSSAETVRLQTDLKTEPFYSPLEKTEPFAQAAPTLKNKSEKIKREVARKSLEILEIAPMISALAHNYWQWLYLSRKNYYEFTDYFLSIEFIIWMLLLITTFVFGIISLKYSERKAFAVTALVVLAINVLLSIVPK